MTPEEAYQALRTIAQEAVPDSLDLWPSIRAQIAERHGAQRLTRKTGVVRWPSRGVVFAIIACLGIVVTAAGVIALSTGQVRETLIFDLENLLVQDVTPTTAVTASSTTFIAVPSSSTPFPAPTAVATTLNPIDRAATDEVFGTQSTVFENTPPPDTLRPN